MHLRYGNKLELAKDPQKCLAFIPWRNMLLRHSGRKFSGILTMLIVQSTDDSKPKPQIGRFLSSGQHSVRSCRRNTNSDGNTNVFCKVLIWGWHLTRNNQFRPHLGDLTPGPKVSRIKWKCLPETREKLVSLLLHCLFPNYLHPLPLKGHWQMAPLRLYKSLQKERHNFSPITSLPV